MPGLKLNHDSKRGHGRQSVQELTQTPYDTLRVFSRTHA